MKLAAQDVGDGLTIRLMTIIRNVACTSPAITRAHDHTTNNSKLCIMKKKEQRTSFSIEILLTMNVIKVLELVHSLTTCRKLTLSW